MSPDQLKKRSVLVRGRQSIQKSTVPIKTRRQKNAVDIEAQEELVSDFFDFEKENENIKSASEQFELTEKLKQQELERKKQEQEDKERAARESVTHIVLEERQLMFAPIEMEEEQVEEAASEENNLDLNFYDILSNQASTQKKEEEPIKLEDFSISSSQQVVIQAPEKKKAKVIDFSTHEDLASLTPLAREIVDKRKPKIVDFSSHKDLAGEEDDEEEEVFAPAVKKEEEKKEEPKVIKKQKTEDKKQEQKTCLFVKPNGEPCKRISPKNTDYCAAHRKLLELN
jgi:hypothetical protein